MDDHLASARTLKRRLKQGDPTAGWLLIALTDQFVRLRRATLTDPSLDDATRARLQEVAQAFARVLKGEDDDDADDTVG